MIVAEENEAVGELDLADERVDVAALLREIADSAGHDGQRVAIVIDAKNTIVRGDAARLRQVFENVVRNALKYSRDPAPVDVRVYDCEAGLGVDVIDHGIGIPPDEVGLLFRRFARASNAKKAMIAGTGIGLFLVKTLVDKHGGSVVVDSRLNEGTTFTIELPRDAAPASVGHVSVLADDSSVGPFLVYTLRQSGFRVRHYRSMAELAEGFDREPSSTIVVHSPSIPIEPQALRVAIGRKARLVAIGGGGEEGWDVVFPTSFLATDLLSALSTNASTGSA